MTIRKSTRRQCPMTLWYANIFDTSYSISEFPRPAFNVRATDGFYAISISICIAKQRKSGEDTKYEVQMKKKRRKKNAC